MFGGGAGNTLLGDADSILDIEEPVEERGRVAIKSSLLGDLMVFQEESYVIISELSNTCISTNQIFG